MECLKVTVLVVLAMSCHASPLPQAESYSTLTSGIAGSKVPLALSEVPVAISHAPALVAPTLVSHAPTLVSHAPAQVSYAPTLVSHAPALVSQAPTLVSHAPALISHAPALVSHAPTLVSQAPVAIHQPTEIEHYAPANYEFKYGVRDEHTHDIKEQAEKRVGDKVTGYYSLLEPDGNTRTVHYSSDKHTGFQAQVTRSGPSAHPTSPVKVVASPAISYQPAVHILP